jgi:L-rhamnose mutarotase
LKRYCLALDLKEDPKLIAEYREHHRNVWPEVKASILSSGIEEMNLYLSGSRLFMIMEVNDAFSFEAKAAADAANEKVQQWESLMWKYQLALPLARPGEKWILMEHIFCLT